MASLLPLSHLFELTAGLLYPVVAGAAIHYIPSRRAPDIMRLLGEQRITHMLVVPQILSIMGQSIEDQLVARFQHAWRCRAEGRVRTSPVCCAPRVVLEGPSQTRRASAPSGVWWRSAGSRHASFLVALQRTRTAGVWHQRMRADHRVCHHRRQYARRKCGEPLQGVDARLGRDGELLVRGPNVMRGYWKDPSRTEAVLDLDGWYATGDLARTRPDCASDVLPQCGLHVGHATWR